MSRNNPETVCEEAVFRALFDRYVKPLHRYLFIRSGNHNLAEDLTQEAFLRLWQACAKVSPQKAKSYLYTVARNLFIDEMKHRKVVSQYAFEAPTAVNNETADRAVIEDEFKRQLSVAIRQLPEKNRTVFLLSRIEKMTYKEIAELLNISVKAVEKRMHKALSELRDFLEEKEGISTLNRSFNKGK